MHYYVATIHVVPFLLRLLLLQCCTMICENYSEGKSSWKWTPSSNKKDERRIFKWIKVKSLYSLLAVFSHCNLFFLCFLLYLCLLTLQCSITTRHITKLKQKKSLLFLDTPKTKSQLTLLTDFLVGRFVVVMQKK